MILIPIFLCTVLFSPCSTTFDGKAEFVDGAVKALTTARAGSDDVLLALSLLGPQAALLMKGVIPIGAIVEETVNPKPKSEEYKALMDLKNRTDDVWRDIQRRTESSTRAIGAKINRPQYLVEMMRNLAIVGYLVVLANCQLPTGNNSTIAARCSQAPRSQCFDGQCPFGFQCVDGGCCDQRNVVQPGGNCQDFLNDCANIECNNIGNRDFARANCARTCNLCYETGPVAPEFACTDLLTDCGNRTGMCRDINFAGMMALYCPRTCLLCTFNDPAGTNGALSCGDNLRDCANRGNFCTASGISQYQRSTGCGKTCGKCAGTQTPTNNNNNNNNMNNVNNNNNNNNNAGAFRRPGGF